MGKEVDDQYVSCKDCGSEMKADGPVFVILDKQTLRGWYCSNPQCDHSYKKTVMEASK